jgi:hypothetical protein
MPRRAVLAVGLYAALAVSLATPLYVPLTSGRDESWLLLVLVVAAHIGLGAAVGRRWVLALPLAFAVLLFLEAGDDGMGWLAILVGAPVLAALTAIGSALGGGLPRRGDAIALSCFAVALVPAAWAAVETARRGPHVPPSVQRRLPTDISLGNLCPGAETPARVEADVRRRAEVLIRELHRRPAATVTYTEYFSDGGDERRDITIHDLAEQQLEDMESNGPGCDPELERRLREAM